MEYSEATARNLRAECARQRISGRELARRLGENYMWSQRRLAGEQPITVDDVARIAVVLGVPVAELMPEVAA